MRRTPVILLFLALAALASAQGKPIITVLDFSVDSVSASEMRSIINVLSSSLFKTGRFTVIDVSQRDMILKEMQFSMSGCSDESCMLEVGKMLSAEGIVAGSIGKVGKRYVLSAKLLETETGKTMSTSDGIYEDLDMLLDGINKVALDLAAPYAGGAWGGGAAGPAPKPADGNVFAWVSLGAGVGCLGASAYFLAVSLPLLIDYLTAQKAYDDAASGADFNALLAAAEAARQAAVNGNASTNFVIGASLAGVGIGLGVLSVILFLPKEEPKRPADAATPAASVSLLPGPDSVRLGFHLRY